MGLGYTCTVFWSLRKAERQGRECTLRILDWLLRWSQRCCQLHPNAPSCIIISSKIMEAQRCITCFVLFSELHVVSSIVALLPDEVFLHRNIDIGNAVTHGNTSPKAASSRIAPWGFFRTILRENQDDGYLFDFANSTSFTESRSSVQKVLRFGNRWVGSKTGTRHRFSMVLSGIW